LEDKKTKKKNRIEVFVINKLNQHCIEIVIGQRRSFSLKPIMEIAKKVYLKYDENSFQRTVSYYYVKEKNRLQQLMRRVEKNKELIRMKEKYKLIDVMMLAKYLTLKGKFKLQSKKDIELLEDICKLTYKIPLFNITESYIERIQNEEEHTLSILNKDEQKEYLKKLENKQSKNIDKYTYD